MNLLPTLVHLARARVGTKGSHHIKGITIHGESVKHSIPGEQVTERSDQSSYHCFLVKYLTLGRVLCTRLCGVDALAKEETSWFLGRGCNMTTPSIMGFYLFLSCNGVSVYCPGGLELGGSSAPPLLSLLSCWNDSMWHHIQFQLYPLTFESHCPPEHIHSPRWQALKDLVSTINHFIPWNYIYSRWRWCTLSISGWVSHTLGPELKCK